MARSCRCEAMTQAMRTDPRFMELGLATRGLFLLLVDLIGRHGDGQRLPLCAAFGSARRIALWFGVSETELETEARALSGAGLLIMETDAWSLPDSVGGYSFRRAAQARINGNQGGRPRKAPGPAADRRQRHMPLVRTIEGGLDMDRKTEAARVPTTSSTGNTVRTEVASTARETDFVGLGAQVAEIIGLDPARGAHSFGQVRNWLDMGASPDMILDVAYQVAHRKSRPRVIQFGYLTHAIRDAIEADRQVNPSPAPAEVVNAGDERFLAAMREWSDNGRLGIPPRRADFRDAA